MQKTRLIDIKQSILSDNKNLAGQLRQFLRQSKTFMVNVMASPGAGKTSLILKTMERFRGVRLGVLEGDIESTLDSEKIAALGVPVVQIRTGGSCHLDAAMVEKGLASIDIAQLDLILIENVGNLVCPAGCDTGAFRNVVILSVPEGDDKPVKYPLIFKFADAVVINKIDYPDFSDFDLDAVRQRVKILNPQSVVFPLSCRTGQGMKSWLDWLRNEVDSFQAD